VIVALPLFAVFTLSPGCEGAENDTIDTLELESTQAMISPSEAMGDQLLEHSLVEERCPEDDAACISALGEELGLTFMAEPADMQTMGTCVSCVTETLFAFGSCPFGWTKDQVSWWVNNQQFGVCFRNICFNTQLDGDVSASPSTVSIGGSLGNTTISWDVDCGSGQVWVSKDGAVESLFAAGNSGSQSAPWIQIGSEYEFCLYEGSGHSNLLDCVTVTGVEAGPSPDPCDSCSSGWSCHCGEDICWPNGKACP